MAEQNKHYQTAEMHNLCKLGSVVFEFPVNSNPELATCGRYAFGLLHEILAGRHRCVARVSTQHTSRNAWLPPDIQVFPFRHNYIAWTPE